MGVAFADYDADGDLDILVANDAVPNFLLRNDGGKYVDVGTSAGVGFNDDGRALSSMGVDFRDVDNDGKEDLFVTALANETFRCIGMSGADSLWMSLIHPGWGRAPSA
jgi:6-phosphogluconate dehydrogenase (decarboxylating)